jgi:hypothetical protein
MSVATSAEGILNGATPRPKQCKLLGATVRNLGVIVAVSSTLTYGYALIEGADRVNHRVAFSALKRDEVEFLLEPQPFVTRVERVDYGVWDEVHSLIPAQPVSLKVAA